MTLHKLDLIKPDGRELSLYSQKPLDPAISAQGTLTEKHRGTSHLRWHPLREEWVAYAGHRQERTFLPPPDYNPLKPMVSAKIPTELPVGNYDIAVFENLFPVCL